MALAATWGREHESGHTARVQPAQATLARGGHRHGLNQWHKTWTLSLLLDLMKTRLNYFHRGRGRDETWGAWGPAAFYFHSNKYYNYTTSFHMCVFQNTFLMTPRKNLISTGIALRVLLSALVFTSMGGIFFIFGRYSKANFTCR